MTLIQWCFIRWVPVKVLPSTPVYMAFLPHNNSNTINYLYFTFRTTRRDTILYSSSPLSPSPSPSSFPLPLSQVFTEENSAECSSAGDSSAGDSSAGDSGAEHQVPKLSLSEVMHIRTISASGDLISLQQEDEKFSKQLEKGKVRW